MKRIPTLDGWRGIAILLVLVTHLQISFGGHLRFAWMDLGQHGVTIFFVLSGYLITSRLLCNSDGGLGRFYLRRCFRLLPCAWLYLLTVVLVGMAMHQPAVNSNFWRCFIITRNYGGFEGVSGLTGHFWSLSIEEQFYLFWPLILVTLGPRRSLFFAVACILACAAWRFSHWNFYESDYNYLRSEVRVDALFVGCSLALAVQSGRVRSFFQRFTIPILLCGATSMCWHIYKFQTLMPLTESVTIAFLLGATSLETSAFTKILEYRHLRFLGTCSYSIYVWQQIFLMPHWGSLTTVIVAFLPLVVIGSYGLIERPGIKLGRRLEKRAERPVLMAR